MRGTVESLTQQTQQLGLDQSRILSLLTSKLASPDGIAEQPSCHVQSNVPDDYSQQIGVKSIVSTVQGTVLKATDPVRRARSPYLYLNVESTSSTCFAGCPCSCHLFKAFTSSRALSSIFGTLFIGYHGVSGLGQKCSHYICRRKSSRLEVTYLFPRWFVQRAITYTLENVSAKGPELCLRFLCVRPEWVMYIPFGSSARRGDSLETRLTYRRASIRDIDNIGDTWLHVKSLVSMVQCVTADLNDG